MKINWSEQSINDLREIISYVGQSFGKQKASEVLENIRSNAERLAMFPLIGKSFVTDQEAEIEYRTVPTKLNQLIYYIDSESVNIVTVWNNRKDIKRLMKQLSK